MSVHFFEELKGFSDFQSLMEDVHYREAPQDWWVVITDVMGSTKAIEAGRYKEVNTVGAATLASLRNAIPDIQFPFVFGGDGASALIPDDYKEAVQRELSALRSISKDRFHLSLRVGMISVKELSAPIHVAKYLLERDYPLAIFRGGGLSKAEEQIKGKPARYEIQHIENAETDLRSLSCRWEPLVASKGTILSLLLYDPHKRSKVYQKAIAAIDAILEKGIAQANPAHTASMKYRGLSDMLRADQKHQRSFLSLFLRQLDTFFAYFLFKWGLYRIIPKLNHYMSQTSTHSDFRKFDDMLRMVLDCTPQQMQRIEEYCTSLRQKEGICYGIHSSADALMTCYVPSFSDGAHIHFIDGGNGGYAIAAKQLKSQIDEYTKK